MKKILVALFTLFISAGSFSQSFQTPNQPDSLSLSFANGSNIISSKSASVVTNTGRYCQGNPPNLSFESTLSGTTTPGTTFFVYRKNGSGTISSASSSAPPSTSTQALSSTSVSSFLADGDYAEVQLQLVNSIHGNCYSNIVIVAKENSITAPTISSTTTPVCVNNTQTFTSNKPSNITTGNHTQYYTDNWSVSNTAYANFSSPTSGFFTATAATPSSGNTLVASDFVTRTSYYSVTVFSGSSPITFSGACNSTATNSSVITINALPSVAAITGTTTVCGIGNTTTLSDATSGGSWSSGNTSVATINSSTGVVTAVAVGTSTISYTTAPNGNGCVNIATTVVTVKAITTSTTTDTVCESNLPYVWNSHNYTTSITDTVHLTNSVGCDSITILKLHIKDCGCRDSCNWSLTGNYAHDYNFIGSRNAVDLTIKTNNTTRIIVPANGIVVAPHTMSQLLIDSDGKLYKSNAASYSRSANTTSTTETQEQINSKLEAEIIELKLQVKALLEARNYSTPCKVETPKANTLEIVPTPFANNSKAIYSLENFSGEAVLQVSDISGKVLKSFPINQSKGQIEIGDLQTTNTTIVFNILGNGRLLASKKSIKLAE